MNTTEISTLRAQLNAAHSLDPQDLMSTETPHLQVAIAEMGEAQFRILLACEDAIREADAVDSFRRLQDFRSDPLRLRGVVCAVCSGHPFGLIHHMAEAIFSAAGFPDSQAWDAGRLGIHIDLERFDAGEFGQQLVALAR